jgi:hypothetical protein
MIRKKGALQLLFFALVMLSTNLFTPAQCEDQPAASVTRKPLQGGVELDERLPALSPEYQVGTKLDVDALTALTPDNMWFPIPKWLAGQLHSENATITSVHFYKTGQTENVHVVRKEIADVLYGSQTDKTGQIWEFIKIPRMQKVAVNGGTAYLRALREDVLNSDDTSVTLKIFSNQLTVNKKDKIIASEQVQQINHYQPLEDGVIQLESSLKNFDADGNPEQLQHGQKLIKRIGPYQQRDSDGNLDLKKLFIEFMTKTGRTDLLPGN